MSFYYYPHHRSASQHPYAQAHASPYAPHHPSPYANAYARYPSAPQDDFEAEERAALAHLRDIQQRRDTAAATHAQAQREAAIRAHIAAQREAAIAAAVERERQLEQQRAQAAMINAHIQRAAQAKAAAIAEAHAARRHAIEAKRAAFQRFHAAKLQAVQAREQARRVHFEEANKRRSCAGPCGREDRGGEDVQALHDFFGRVFGFTFVPEESQKEEVKERSQEKTGEKTDATTVESTPQPAVQPAAAEVKSSESTENKAKASDVNEPNQNSLPNNLNDLISTFLGLQVDPAGDNDKSTDGADKLTEKLNHFLGPFGLQFEADTRAEPSPSASASASSSNNTAPAPAPVPTPTTPKGQPERSTEATPITSFLNGVTDIPPFVRDILANVELAFKEERNKEERKEHAVEGKGKGVAPGEKSTPVPAPTSTGQTNSAAAEPEAESKVTPGSLDKLRDISHELHLATSSFDFPTTLTFAPSSEEITPPLPFNKVNSGYHAQAHKLLQLLLAADGISSGGDREVRKQRKAVVTSVESAIEELEKKRDAVWKGVREKRQSGVVESEDEGSVSSRGSSVDVEVTEHVENVSSTDDSKPIDVNFEGDADANAKANAAVPASSETAEEVTGFDVPEVQATEQPGVKVAKSTEVEVAQPADAEEFEPKAELNKPDDVTETAEAAENNEEKEKDEGYELI